MKLFSKRHDSGKAIKHVTMQVSPRPFSKISYFSPEELKDGPYPLDDFWKLTNVSLVDAAAKIEAIAIGISAQFVSRQEILERFLRIDIEAELKELQEDMPKDD